MDPIATNDDQPEWHGQRAVGIAVASLAAGTAGIFRLPLMLTFFHPGCFLAATAVAIAVIAWPLALLEMAAARHFRTSAPLALSSVRAGAEVIAIGTAVVLAVVAGYLSAGAGQLLYPTLSHLGAMVRAGTDGTSSESGLGAVTTTINRWGVTAVVLGLWVLAGVGSAVVPAALAARIQLVSLTVVLVVLVGLMLCVPAAVESAAVVELLWPSASVLRAQWGRASLWANAVGQALLTVQSGTGALWALQAHARTASCALRSSLAVSAGGIAITFIITIVACAGAVAAGSTSVGASHSGQLVALSAAANLTSSNSSSSAQMAATVHSFGMEALGSSFDPTPYALLDLMRPARGGGFAVLAMLIALVLWAHAVVASALSLRVFTASLRGMRLPLTGRALGIAAAMGCALAAVLASRAVALSHFAAVLDQAAVGAVLPMLAAAQTWVLAVVPWPGQSPTESASPSAATHEPTPAHGVAPDDAGASKSSPWCAFAAPLRARLEVGVVRLREMLRAAVHFAASGPGGVPTAPSRALTTATQCVMFAVPWWVATALPALLLSAAAASAAAAATSDAPVGVRLAYACCAFGPVSGLALSSRYFNAHTDPPAGSTWPSELVVDAVHAAEGAMTV